MTWKCTLAELSFGGGAKSSIIADQKNMPKEEKLGLVRAFAIALKLLSPSQNEAAPNINTGEEEMVIALANGSLNSCTGKPSSICVRPSGKCGILHEYGSTAYGVLNVIIVASDYLSLDLMKATVAIDGFCNKGFTLLK